MEVFTLTGLKHMQYMLSFLSTCMNDGKGEPPRAMLHSIFQSHVLGVPTVFHAKSKQPLRQNCNWFDDHSTASLSSMGLYQPWPHSSKAGSSTAMLPLAASDYATPTSFRKTGLGLLREEGTPPASTKLQGCASPSKSRNRSPPHSLT